MKKIRLVSKKADAESQDENGKLMLMLKDGRGQPITVRTRVLVKEEVSGSNEYRLESKEGEVTRFVFELPPGVYLARVMAEGFKDYSQSITVASGTESVYEFILELRGLGECKEEEEEKEAELLRGRFIWFSDQRNYPGKEFPSDARQKALVQKMHMHDPDVINARLKVEEIEDPLPKTSFGSIGAFVNVDSRDPESPFPRSILKIPYSLEKLGWVNETTLRVFEIDVEERQFHLIKESGVDIERQYTFAYIEKPGIYGVIGLPQNSAVLETVRLFCSLQSQLVDEKRRDVRTLHERICQLILCAQEFEKSAEIENLVLPVLPGGIGGNVCDFCLNIDIPDGGLPECRLLPEPTGPVVIPGCNWLSNGPRNINGRVRALAIHPSDGNTVYAGTANGGVWVSRNAGQSWKPLMHDELALEIGALGVHLTDPANPVGDVTIYAGTGEPTSWPGYKGVGVLKSTDSGVTWNLTGTLPAPGNNGFSAILIDPTSVTAVPTTTIVYAGGNPGGLYKSINGGTTWTLMLNKNITGLAMDPTNPAIIYAAVAFEGIYKYDPVTATWSTFNTGLTGPFPQLIQVVIGHSAPHQMYAKLDQTVYVYNTATSSWQSLGNHGSTTYGYWNNVLAVDPQDSNIVFAGGIIQERSYDGGTTWQTIGGLHSDQHALVFDSINHLNVYAGNDGGVYRGVYTSPSDTGTWTKVSNGLIITQFNQVGISPAGPDIIGGGSQDNGTNRSVGGLTWDNILGADGGFFIVDPANPYILYAESENGGIAKSTNGGVSWVGATSGFPGGPWVTPIVLDPTSPPEPNRVLFAGGTSQVYRSTNSAGNWVSSTPNVGGQVTAIALAPSSSAVVYTGIDTGRVWRSSDNGATTANWKDITVGTVAGSVTLPTRFVMDVAVHPTNPDIVFVTFSGFNSATPTTPGHVFRGTSTDGGVNWKWEDISSNLPDIPVNAIQVNPASPNTIYIGTDIGVFRSTDGGLSWNDFGAGLPNVVIADLALNATGDLLRAATYGRGMWELRLSSICPNVDVYIRDNKLDTGETIPSPSGVPDPTMLGINVYWWESADIKVDAYPYFPVSPLFDGVDFDIATAEDVVRNDAAHPNPNRLYVQVHNRGPLPAHNVKVKVLWADASAGLPPLPADFWASFPNDWSAPSAWNTVDPAASFKTIPELLPNTPVVLMWNWIVPTTAAEHTCMLAVISADEDPVNRSDANPNDHLLWLIVPNDKHIALRNLHVITGAAPGGLPIPISTFIDFYNPLKCPQRFDLIFDLSMLPEETNLSLLLPKVQMQTSVHGCVLEGKLDPCTGRKLAHILGILIPANEKLRASLVISSFPKARPGSIHRFVVMQQQQGTVIGGSTYEIRISPAEEVSTKKNED